MKKNYLLFLLLIFILPIKSFGQVEPKLTDKIYQTYSHNDYWKHAHQIISYNNNGDTLSIITNNYNWKEEVLPGNGHFFEYDNQNRLIRKVNKRYNPDVDLWITDLWRNYFYGDDGCIKQEELVFNVGGIQESWEFLLDEDCRKITGESINLTFPSLVIVDSFIYPDENNSLMISTSQSNQVGEWNETEQNEWIKNEEGDIVKRVNLLHYYWSPSLDTASFSIQLYEYDYMVDFLTGRLITKFQKFYSNKGYTYISPFNPITFHLERRYDYEYYCDGLLSKETLNIIGDWKPTSRILYFYEGKNDCFDYEQDLEIKILPNPSFGQIELQSLMFRSGDTELKIYTVGGVLVFEKLYPMRSHYQNVDLSYLEKGVYIIQLRSGKYFSTSKLVMVQ